MSEVGENLQFCDGSDEFRRRVARSLACRHLAEVALPIIGDDFCDEESLSGGQTLNARKVVVLVRLGHHNNFLLSEALDDLFWRSGLLKFVAAKLRPVQDEGPNLFVASQFNPKTLGVAIIG